MTKIEEFKDYFDTIESMYGARIIWHDEDLVMVTLKSGGLGLSRMFNARGAELMPISGSVYADRLFKDMLKEFEDELKIHGVYS